MQDLYVFADHDGVFGEDLFVQGQDGRISYYWAYKGTEDSNYEPVFALQDENYGNMMLLGDTGVEPRGIAIADFNNSGDKLQEFVAAWHKMEDGTDA